MLLTFFVSLGVILLALIGGSVLSDQFMAFGMNTSALQAYGHGQGQAVDEYVFIALTFIGFWLALSCYLALFAALLMLIARPMLALVLSVLSTLPALSKATSFDLEFRRMVGVNLSFGVHERIYNPLYYLSEFIFPRYEMWATLSFNLWPPYLLIGLVVCLRFALISRKDFLRTVKL